MLSEGERCIVREIEGERGIARDIEGSRWIAGNSEGGWDTAGERERRWMEKAGAVKESGICGASDICGVCGVRWGGRAVRNTRPNN